MRLSKTEFYMLLTAGLLAFLAYQLAGYLAIGVLGLLIGFIAVRMDLEKEGAIGSAFAGNLYLEQMTAQQSMNRSDRAAHRAEIGSLARPLMIAKLVGAVLIVVGFGALICF
jgi:uncharacterized protein (DUF2062 family)